jgi:hypothetical protein
VYWLFQGRVPSLVQRIPAAPCALQVKGSVEGGLSYLQEGRKRDPYKDVLRRLAYELPAWGGAQPRQAPSFEP